MSKGVPLGGTNACKMEVLQQLIARHVTSGLNSHQVRPKGCHRASCDSPEGGSVGLPYNHPFEELPCFGCRSLVNASIISPGSKPSLKQWDESACYSAHLDVTHLDLIEDHQCRDLVGSVQTVILTPESKRMSQLIDLCAYLD